MPTAATATEKLRALGLLTRRHIIYSTTAYAIITRGAAKKQTTSPSIRHTAIAAHNWFAYRLENQQKQEVKHIG